MDWLSSYQDSTDKALDVMVSAPLEVEKPKAKHSAWTTIPRAVAAGAVEVGGNIVDAAGAFGQVAAASGGLTPGFDPDQQRNRAASLEAADKLKTEGIDWRTDESRTQYEFARDLRPDPLTAGTAENIVFGLTKGLTKAIGGAVALGTAGGAAAFGTSEGLGAAEDLAAQGVDLATRTKVGAVTGAMTAAGVALPVAGNTLAKTAGLVITGGPASFIAQQVATRKILEGADYNELAQQYDPLDPVGLAVATLLPAGFGAFAHMAGRTAKPVAKLSQDDLDAVMTHNLTAIRDVHEAVGPDVVSESMGGAHITRAPDDAAMPAPIKDVVINPEAPAEAIRARVDAMKAEVPDMPVGLREDGKPVRLADELEAAKLRAQEGTDTELGALDAPLLKVAAECFLTIGPAV